MAFDERLRYRMAIAGGILFVLAVVGWVWLALRSADTVPVASPQAPQKVFRRTLVEDLRVTRHGIRGVDLIRCKTCRLEKRKRGVFTFGGLNTLVMEDLEVVLPSDGAEGGKESSHSAKDVMRRIGVSDGFLAERGIPYSFSGVKIMGLTLSRLLCDNTLQRIFSAQRAEAVKGGLALSGCRMACLPEERPVGKAMLSIDGGMLRLKWRGGEMYLNENKKE